MSTEWQKKLRRIVLNRDNWICQYCFKKLVPQNHGATEFEQVATIDHKIPISRCSSVSNAWKLSNLCACCRQCNEGKGALSAIEWLIVLAFRRGEVRLLNELQKAA